MSLTGACGFGLIEDEEGDDEAESFAPVVSRYDERQGRRAPAPHDDESPGLGLTSLGALAHLAISARTAVAQKIEAVRDGSWRGGAADPYSGNSPALAARRAFAEPGDAEAWDEPEAGPERPARTGRREPVFADGAPRRVEAPRRAEPALDDDAADRRTARSPPAEAGSPPLPRRSRPAARRLPFRPRRMPTSCRR